MSSSQDQESSSKESEATSSKESEAAPPVHQGYRVSQKPMGRACGHFTFSWDNHDYCLSCQLWGGKGAFQGLPCVSREQTCHWCAFWPPEVRKKYMSALIDRIQNPTGHSSCSQEPTSSIPIHTPWPFTPGCWQSSSSSPGSRGGGPR